MSPEPRVIPRSVQAEIVTDLAKGHRSVSSIAGRHHVPKELVLALRDTYGPDLGNLSDAAEMLRRPALRDAASAPAALAEASGEPAPPKTWKRYQDGLTLDAGDDFVAECVNCDTKLLAGRCPVCECPECGEPLDDLLTCPECDAARRAADWDRFYGECLAIPALADHCRAVADAVERLRDARAEYEHREGLVSRIAQVIDDGLGYQEADDIARAVLDLIEAA